MANAFLPATNPTAPTTPHADRRSSAFRSSLLEFRTSCECTKPKSGNARRLSSTPGIDADQVLWTWLTPGKEFVPSTGMFLEEIDDDAGSVLVEFEAVAEDSDENSFLDGLARRAELREMLEENPFHDELTEEMKKNFVDEAAESSAFEGEHGDGAEIYVTWITQVIRKQRKLPRFLTK